jgi:uncharacterized protein with HEPN domain
MQLRAKKYLYDVQQACRLLEQFAAGKQLRDYEADALLRSGVERQFEVIGEALRPMREIEPGLVDKIADARRIISFRNVLIHGYASVSNQTVWEVLTTDLPRLRTESDELLSG